jgi:hypothetical protein
VIVFDYLVHVLNVFYPLAACVVLVHEFTVSTKKVPGALQPFHAAHRCFGSSSGGVGLARLVVLSSSVAALPGAVAASSAGSDIFSSHKGGRKLRLLLLPAEDEHTTTEKGRRPEKIKVTEQQEQRAKRFPEKILMNCGVLRWYK